MGFKINGYSLSSQVTNFIPFFSEVRSSFSTWASNRISDGTPPAANPFPPASTLGRGLKTAAGLPEGLGQALKEDAPTPGAIVKPPNIKVFQRSSPIPRPSIVKT